MENPYDLFLALLAPKVWGGVTIPTRFAAPFSAALLASIDDDHAVYDDARYVTGQIDSERLRRTIEQLLDPVVGHIEQQYNQSLGADLDMHEMPILRRTGNGLELMRCADAKRTDEYFRMFEPEYAGIKERFPTLFAQYIDPSAPQQALRLLGQVSRESPVESHT